jgi:hypothetical protein
MAPKRTARGRSILKLQKNFPYPKTIPMPPKSPTYLHPLVLRVQNNEYVETRKDCIIEAESVTMVWFKDDCLLRVVTTNDCLVNDSQFFNSTINRSILKNCVLFDCTWDEETTMEHCQVITETLAFRRFPSVVRTLIFEHAVEGNGVMPPLIVALRGDQQLYREALNVFSKKNEFVYCGLKLADTNHAAIARIYSLSLV